MAKNFAEHQLLNKMLLKGAEGAAMLALRVRLLVWVAYANWIGLVFTAAEIGYLLYKDDDLQNWCEKSVFRKQKKTPNLFGGVAVNDRFTNAAVELLELAKASHAIGIEEKE